jgi:putative ABC transport system ATP-binding protein
MACIELRKLSRVYQVGKVQVEALKPADLSIDEGEFVAIMGASGSGKSTMLNLLGLLDKPSSGEYILDGSDVAKLNDWSRSKIRCRKIGIVFQSFNLLTRFSVLENVCLPMRYAKVGRREMRDRARELLESVGLGHRIDHTPQQLSGGECQRVAVARALANNPVLVLADEPTGNLDEKTGYEILAILHDLVDNQKKTVVMVTHNPEYVDEVGRVVRLHDGEIEKT